MKRSLEKDESTIERSAKQQCIHNEDNTTTPTHEDYNHIVQETTDTMIQLFIRRATAYEKLSHFTNALDDAEWIMTHAHTLAEGYLLTATLYSNQGKEQEAMEIWQLGLAHATAATQEQRQQLKDGWSRSKQRSERRIDFVIGSLLPVEILSMIWTYVGVSESLVEAMLVSKSWRNMILQSPSVWKSISTCSEEMDTAIVSLMPKVGAYVHHLSLLHLRRYYYTPHITYLSNMSDGVFCHLKSLYVDVRVDANLLSMALYKVKNTLTKLEIVYDMLLREEAAEENAILPLPEIMDICPYLQELKYVTNGPLGLTRRTTTSTDRRRGDSTTMMTQQEEEIPCAIIRLDLFQHLIMDDEDIITVNQLHQITKRCHNLHLITLRNFKPAFLDVLGRYCPQLQHVFFINHESDIPDDYDELAIFHQQDDTQYPGSKGLRTLSIMSEAVHVRSIEPYLHQHCQTLRSLSLLLDAAPFTTRQEDSFVSLEHAQQDNIPYLPAMKNFMVFQMSGNQRHPSSESVSSADAITHLIRQCPVLENFTIYGDMLYKSYFHALRETSGSHLKSIILQVFTAEPGALAAFLCHEPSQLGLHTFRAYFLPVEDLYLDSLSDIPTLKNIRLSCRLKRPDRLPNSLKMEREQQREQLKQVHWDSFFMKLQERKTLQVFELDGTSFIQDQDLIAIAGISSLKRILLQRLEEITDQGLETMVELLADTATTNHHPCPVIQVIDCSDLSEKSIDYAQHVLSKHGSSIQTCHC